MRDVKYSVNRSTPVEPLQDRAHRTRAAIVASARQVIIDVGRNRATTAQVAASAGVGIGTFYRYFADYADVLGAVLRENEIYANHQKILQAAHRAANSDDAKAAALEALQALIDSLKEHSVLESDLCLYA
jgi:AcrR family transcriptional regulator